MKHLSKKTIAVVFIENNARILVNPENLSALKRQDNVVINPDLSEVRHLPPHLWELRDGKVIPMSSKNQKQREKIVESNIPNNRIIIKTLNPYLLVLSWIAAVGIGLLIGLSKCI